MTSTTLTLVRFSLALLTLLLLAIHPYLPPRTTELFADTRMQVYGYGPDQSYGWIDPQNHHLRCELKLRPASNPCGLFFTWPDLPQGRNLSAIIGLRLKIHYEGTADVLQVYLRNRNPAHSREGDSLSDKFLSLQLFTNRLKAGTVLLPLSEFSVPEWWLRQFNPARAHYAPEFNAVTGIGIENTDNGLHKIRVEQIALVELWPAYHQLVYGLAIFWLLYGLFEAVWRSAKRAGRHPEQLMADLARPVDYSHPQNKLSNSTAREIDLLTGLRNRTGLDALIKTLDSESRHYGLMAIDIDDFRHVNQEHGRQVGDRVLCQLVDAIQHTIRANDDMARWGGGELILVCPNTGYGQLALLAERIRSGVENPPANARMDAQISVSIGFSVTRNTETFSAALKRTRGALYNAKQFHNCCHGVE